MTNKVTSIVILLLFTIMPIMALEDLGEYKQNQCITIRQTCATCTYVNVSITEPHNSSLVIDNKAMTNQDAGVWTYYFCGTQALGRYDVIGKGDLSGVDTSFATYFNIGLEREIADTKLTESGIFLIIAILLCIFMYASVSKLIGSMGIFVSGFGVLFKIPQHGWIGWIIIIGGLIMLIYGLLIPEKNKVRMIRKRY